MQGMRIRKQSEGMGSMAVSKLILLGVGGRGGTYARHSRRYGAEIVAAVDLNREKLEQFGREYGVPQERLYSSWEECLSKEKFADAVINATPDRIHYRSTMAALDKGYHVLLEKPMAQTEAECREIVERAEEKGLLLMVCHVLRYAGFFEKLKELYDAGAIGQLINLELTENESFWHHAHSYVRGVFRREEESNPWILSKSCHDLDLIVYITGKRCLSVVSEGERSYFSRANAPEGGPERCLEGCPREQECLYFAPRVYLSQFDHVGWPATHICQDTSYNARLEALRSGPYGRCVFRCDNDVMDRQSAVFQLEGGATATFNAIGLSSENTRVIRLFGSQGELYGSLTEDRLTLTSFSTGRREVFDTSDPSNSSYHGGGDYSLTEDFLNAVATGRRELKTSARLSLQSHLMGFAAERSRKEGIRVEIESE